MIEVKSLTKNYGPRTAIHNLSFSINKGEVVGFLGPNGAGKSTTMKILTGYIPATTGQAIVAGFDVFENPLEVKRNVGYLPETPPVYTEMRVEEYIQYTSLLRGFSKNQAKSMTKVAIEKTALGDVRNRLIGNLSKGFRQRVGIAQAIVHNPQVLILDEPTVGLDPRQIIEIRDLVKSLAGNHTVILSTHILQEVTQTCDRIIIISKGKIAAQESIETLTGQTRYSLTVRNPKNDGVEALRSIEGVKDVSIAGSKLILEIDPKRADAREKIVDTAVQKGMGVLEFTTGKVSLEEVFLQLTNQ
jgi:ABC-2 type transport system ATP-binding protein